MNAIFILFLNQYSNGYGRTKFIGPLPEVFAILVTFVFTVTIINTILGWYYVGKPPISDLYTTSSETSTSPGIGTTREEGD